jgi:hypothetical protein
MEQMKWYYVKGNVSKMACGQKKCSRSTVGITAVDKTEVRWKKEKCPDMHTIQQFGMFVALKISVVFLQESMC